MNKLAPSGLDKNSSSEVKGIRITASFSNLKTGCAILSVSYRQFSTDRREKLSLTRSIFVYTDALLLNIHRRIR